MRYGRRQSGEGAGMGGSQMRSRFDKMEEERLRREKLQKARDSVRSGTEPNFSDLPEIKAMRDRATAAKEKMANTRETPEMVARRLKARRG